MVKKIVVIIAILALLPPVSVFGAGKGDDLDKILGAAERFFQVLKAKSYGQTWSYLSARSRETIVDDMYKGLNGRYSREQIRSDMQAGGMIAAGYWKGVLNTFDPAIVLEKCKWDTGKIGPREAELLITGKKAPHPAQLMMYLEDGSWRVGLVESFWTRKK